MFEGKLQKNDCGRWEIVNDDGDRELTSGSVCYVLIGDQWLRTRIESSDGEYYSTLPGIILYRGMWARTK